MTDKTSLWDRLGKTDPKHTKTFKRAGGFSGTSIKPMYSYRRMTEEYGSCGVGWGINEPVFQTVPSVEGEVLVYCTVSIWHGDRDSVVFGVGGDKAVGKNKFGAFADDEAFKKAFTDAVTNALKLIGVGADIHMGMFDDDKYVNELRQEFAEDVDDSKQRFIEETKASIERIGAHPDPNDLLRWWNSEPEKQKRRDFDLTPAEVIELKGLVTAKGKR